MAVPNKLVPDGVEALIGLARDPSGVVRREVDGAPGRRDGVGGDTPRVCINRAASRASRASCTGSSPMRSAGTREVLGVNA